MTNNSTAEFNAIINEMNADGATFLKKSAGISNLISLATTKIPKPTTVNSTNIKKISNKDVKIFVEIVQKIVEKVKEIDVKFLNNGLKLVVAGLKPRVQDNSQSNTKKMMYMYAASTLSNNFKQLVKPGENGKFAYQVEASNLPKISKMNAILSTINLSTLTNANIQDLFNKAQVPSPQNQLEILAEKAEEIKGEMFESNNGRKNYNSALKLLNNTKQRGGNGNGGAPRNNGTPTGGNGGAPRNNGTPNGGNVPRNNTPATIVNATAAVTNALSQQNAENIKNLLKTNKSPENILNAIRLVKENNRRLTKTVWDASTNKLKILRNYQLFSNNLDRLAAQTTNPLPVASTNAVTAALKQANMANANALQAEGPSTELAANTQVNAQTAIKNANQANLLAQENPTNASLTAAEQATEVAREANNLANAAGNKSK